MTRPAILDQDVVVVPREPTTEMFDMFWQQTGESREMYSRVCSRAERHHTVMLSASPHADAWAEVRAYVGELERLKTCGMTELTASNPSAMDYVKHWEGRVQSAEARVVDLMNDHARLCEGREYTCTCGYDEQQEARISELEARLKEAERVIEPFADAARRIDAQYDAETGGQGPMLDDETATIMPLGDHWEVATVGHLRRARTFMEGSK